ARRRRLGPFGAGVVDRAARARQIAVLLRAGHALDSARELVDAASIAAAEDWAAQAGTGDKEA
ncbi:MAG: RecX family transcriptional regulator, partial [Sphingomonadales bacterium]|nr:RecX family transcriptional regulator [Sphingomonadales bacterium]